MSRAKNKKNWKHAKKIEVVTTYLALGNAPLTSGVTGVPSQTIKQWKMQPWWNELVDQIRIDENTQTDAKLTKIIDRALDVVADRITEGDFQYDPKTGQLMRVPVKMRDAHAVSSDLIDRRELIRKAPKEAIAQATVSDHLMKLAEQFASFVSQKQEKVIEGEFVALHDKRQEGLQEGIREVSGNTGATETPSGA